MRLALFVAIAILATGCTGGPLLPSTKTPTPVLAAAQPTNTQPAVPAASGSNTPAPAGSPATGSPTAAASRTVSPVASGSPAANASVSPTRTITGTVTAVASRTGTPPAGGTPGASPVAGGTVTTSVTGATPVEATEKYLLGRGVFGFDLALEGEVGDFARVRVSPKAGGSATTAYVQKQGATWIVIGYGGTAPSNVPPALQQIPAAPPVGSPSAGTTPGVPGIVIPTVTTVPAR